MTQSVTGQNANQVQDADTLRVTRAFVGFLNSALGTDQNYIGEDSYVGNAPGQYIIANADGSYSIIGKSVSNVQGQTQTITYPGQTTTTDRGLNISPMLVLMGIAAFLLLKKMG